MYNSKNSCLKISFQMHRNKQTVIYVDLSAVVVRISKMKPIPTVLYWCSCGITKYDENLLYHALRHKITINKL